MTVLLLLLMMMMMIARIRTKCRRSLLEKLLASQLVKNHSSHSSFITAFTIVLHFFLS
jgi:hypothetical protein